MEVTPSRPTSQSCSYSFADVDSMGGSVDRPTQTSKKTTAFHNSCRDHHEIAACRDNSPVARTTVLRPALGGDDFHTWPAPGGKIGFRHCSCVVLSVLQASSRHVPRISLTSHILENCFEVRNRKKPTKNMQKDMCQEQIGLDDNDGAVENADRQPLRVPCPAQCQTVRGSERARGRKGTHARQTGKEQEAQERATQGQFEPTTERLASAARQYQVI